MFLGLLMVLVLTSLSETSTTETDEIKDSYFVLGDSNEVWNVTQNGSTCIILKAWMYLKYPLNNMTMRHQFTHESIDFFITGDCSGPVQRISFIFNLDQYRAANLSITFEHHKQCQTELLLMITTNDTVFYYIGDFVPLYPVGSYYYCNLVERYALYPRVGHGKISEEEGSKTLKDNTSLEFVVLQIKMQAFRRSNSTEFLGTVYECDTKWSQIMPIIVAVVVAAFAFTFAIVVAYRRRVLGECSPPQSPEHLHIVTSSPPLDYSSTKPPSPPNSESSSEPPPVSPSPIPPSPKLVQINPRNSPNSHQDVSSAPKSLYPSDNLVSSNEH